ncbi:VOC family protein [Bacillus timonensis]|uniref:VOC family protein n=1 Tax=Bacillus timonensis TaxID=1033734 RepID=A0A4S3PNL3_9BACI|nr:VOC family protein [Bacillus timonensis]THE10736.1 VOC family protein [Bacillus timonensis]
MNLTHIRLLVDNYKECFIFYRDILGFEVSWGDENSTYADFTGIGGVKLGLFERQQMVAAIGSEYVPLVENQDKTTLIFKVKSVEDTYEKMKDKLEFITKPHEQVNWMLKVAHFRDPTGNLIEIYENL